MLPLCDVADRCWYQVRDCSGVDVTSIVILCACLRRDDAPAREASVSQYLSDGEDDTHIGQHYAALDSCFREDGANVHSI